MNRKDLVPFIASLLVFLGSCCPPINQIDVQEPVDQKSVSCSCEGACLVNVAGSLGHTLEPNEKVFLAVRPVLVPPIGHFIQQVSATVTNTSWSVEAQLGSSDFPPAENNQFELRAFIVQTTAGSSSPPLEVNELSATTIEGFVVASEPHTVSVQCEGTFEQRLFEHLNAQQHPVTGLLESFVARENLPAEFREFLEERPSFAYDNSVAALAYFSRCSVDDMRRATRILDALVQLQQDNGAIPDVVNAETLDVIGADFGTGNQSWAILALIKAFRVLGDERYLSAAELAGNFVLQQASTVGYGGFTLFPGSMRVSTEHNADAYAAFTQLADELATRGETEAADSFRTAATRARVFVESRFDPETGKTFTGTEDDGDTTNPFPVPEDTQTWTLLSLGGSKWLRSYNWLLGPEGLWTNSTSCAMLNGEEVMGPAFSSADLSEVWMEGLGHVWVAEKLLNGENGVAPTPASIQNVLEAVQMLAPNSDGMSLVAACATLDTGFNFSFFNTPAVAPTAWAIFGAECLNPFWDQPTDSGLEGHPGFLVPWVAIDVPESSVFSCAAADPCVFMVTGTSTGVAGQNGLALHVLIRPNTPSTGPTFLQAVPASLEMDGTWFASAQLGSSEFPVASGDTIKVSAIIMVSSAEPPPIELDTVTPDGILGLVAVSGILNGTVEVGP